MACLVDDGNAPPPAACSDTTQGGGEERAWLFADPDVVGDHAEVLRQRRRQEEAAPLLMTLKRELDGWRWPCYRRRR